jgi:SAM-dependent methyltransferase
MISKIKSTAKKILKKAGYELVDTKKNDDSALYLKLFGEESVAEKRFYNVCGGGHMRYGGGFEHPLWRNLDILRSSENWNDSYIPEKDIVHDMLAMNPLPIKDNAAELIQSQYSIEHIHDEAAFYFFKEAYRALKPGGVLKIVVPNIELDYVAFRRNDKSYFAIEAMSIKKYYERSGFKTPYNQTSFEQVFMTRFAGNATIIHGGNNPNKITDEEFHRAFSSMEKEDAFTHCSSKCSVEVQKEIRSNHINWWNHNKVIKAMKNAGFKDTYIMAPGQSASPAMRNQKYFDNLWNQVALFAEAIKD